MNSLTHHDNYFILALPLLIFTRPNQPYLRPIYVIGKIILVMLHLNKMLYLDIFAIIFITD